MKKILVVCILTLASKLLFSQTCPALQFVYDADGNRTNVTVGTIGCGGGGNYQMTVNPKDSSTSPSISASVYPNPSIRQLNITIDKSNDANAPALSAVSLIDLTGRVIFSTITSTDYAKFDVASLAAGMYYVKIINGNHNLSYMFSKQ